MRVINGMCVHVCAMGLGVDQLSTSSRCRATGMGKDAHGSCITGVDALTPDFSLRCRTSSRPDQIKISIHVKFYIILTCLFIYFAFPDSSIAEFFLNVAICCNPSKICCRVVVIVCSNIVL